LAKNNRSLLLIGNFLSSKGMNQGISKNLYELLTVNGWSVLFSSTYLNKWLRLLDMITSAIKWRKQYQVANIDVFSSRSFIWAQMMGLVFCLLNKPFVCTLRGGNLAVFEQENPTRVRSVLNKATKVVTPSSYLKNHFSKTRNDIILIPNGIDLSCYKYQPRKETAPKLVWLRALHEIYAPTMAVKVLHLLQDKFPDICLTMVGPDKGDGSLEKVNALIDQYGLGDAVHIIGGVDKKQVPYWLNQGDIFINTTRIESFGVSVLEAAACGMPIVTTDAGELPYIWEDGVDALVVPVDDASAMANAFERILKHPDLAQKLSMNARKKSENYDWSLIIPKWEALFEDLLENE